MKYYLVAGEASGDLHGSNLIKELKKKDPAAEFRCFGGDLMQMAGAEIALHYKEMSFIGIWEIIRNIRTINKSLELCRQDISAFTPDAVILIDYPGFNLKIAQYVKNKGIKTLFYIAPKVWASRKWRIKKIKKYIDKLYTILPFEEKYFKARGCDSEYVGNPLRDAIDAYEISPEKEFRKANQLADKPVIAILSGSRKMEIKLCLPEMLAVVRHYPEYQFVIAGAPSIPQSYYKEYLADSKVKIIFNQTYDLLNLAEAAMVVSGTATLETALFKVPEVVMYKLSPATYFIGRPFVHIRFFSLVNLIMDREVVKELLQFNLAGKIKKEMDKILYNKEYRQKILKDYNELDTIIGKSGTSERVAKSIYNYLKG